MVSGHGKKQRAKQRARRTGTGHAAAVTRTAHEHTPLPDMSHLSLLPHGGGQPLDLDLAARLVAAARSGCQPCQKSMTPVLRQHRPTLAALAGAIYGTLPAGWIASAATRDWAPLARAEKDSGGSRAALAAVEAMTEEQAADLLEDALDHWAAGEAGPDLFQVIDLALPKDPDGVARYAVLLGRTVLPDGRAFPMLSLECETAGAGFEDLRRRTDWQDWNGRQMPKLDTTWCVRTDIATRSLQCLVQVDAEGWDVEPHLWDASETIALPEHWWDLLDRSQHILVAGPLKDAADESALSWASDSGELLAVVARVSFT
ncbi:hypothetical protein [Streptacidiphilus carbonis]|uniref:hypothetical protein n=1 Tax=Streptacidiphilus carbonis TaxID=105422 RepID=UPI000A036A7D|nr:hypothetical protein [Streptacidiphilus carbonis]